MLHDMLGAGGAEITMIFLMLAIPLVAIVAGTFLLALKIWKGKSPKKEELQEDEARLIQEIHRGLARLEDRVEALETILLEKEERAKERYEHERKV